MEANQKLLRAVFLCLGIVLILSCNLMNDPKGDQPDPSAVETDVAIRVMSTSLANELMTLQAVQTAVADQVLAVQPSQTGEPPQQPTQIIQPSSIPTQTDVPPPAALVLGVQTSVRMFYCYQSPYELTITVKVSDINRGMAVYYHIQDKKSGVTSDGQSLDLHRNNSDTRSATIIGGGSVDQNLQFPPLMSESYFIYQIISDDGSYRSPAYSEVTFFPCAQ